MPKPPAAFTPKELKIIKLICKGYSSQEIAQKLDNSIRTIETHRDTIYKKAKVDNVVRLVIYAIRRDMVKI